MEVTMGSQGGAAPQGEEPQDVDEINVERQRYRLFIRATEQYIAEVENENASLKAQIQAAVREDAVQMPVFLPSDVQIELVKERERSIRLSQQCREISLQRREAQLGWKETALELKETRHENKKLKESNQELQALNQRLIEALDARLPGSRAANATVQSHLPPPPSFGEARVNDVDQNHEQLQSENKAWELTQLVVSHLTRMSYAAGLRGSAGHATWSHEATDFSFSLDLCSPPYGPPQGVRGGKVVRYRPHSLGTLREVAPSWMRNQLLLDIHDLPLLIKRLIWVAEKRIL